MRRLPLEDRTDLFAEIGQTLAGSEREKLKLLAARMGLVAWAKSKTESRSWSRRLQGARLITLLGADAPASSGLRWDKNESVRARAA